MINTVTEERFESAFKWIITILREHQIPFVITGGLAARAYGATRPLYDIDIDIPEGRFPDILPDVQARVVTGPAHYADEHWDLYAMTLNFNGTNIDISGAQSAKAFDAKSGTWVPCPTDLSQTETHEIFGISVPVMAKDNLIAYKRLVGRPTDLQDIEETR